MFGSYDPPVVAPTTQSKFESLQNAGDRLVSRFGVDAAHIYSFY